MLVSVRAHGVEALTDPCFSACVSLASSCARNSELSPLCLRGERRQAEPWPSLVIV